MESNLGIVVILLCHVWTAYVFKPRGLRRQTEATSWFPSLMSLLSSYWKHEGKKETKVAKKLISCNCIFYSSMYIICMWQQTPCILSTPCILKQLVHMKQQNVAMHVFFNPHLCPNQDLFNVNLFNDTFFPSVIFCDGSWTERKKTTKKTTTTHNPLTGNKSYLLKSLE